MRIDTHLRYRGHMEQVDLCVIFQLMVYYELPLVIDILQKNNL